MHDESYRILAKSNEGRSTMYGEMKGKNRIKLDPLVDDPIKIVKWAQ